MAHWTQKLDLLQRPDETHEAWTERTGGQDAVETMDPFAEFRDEADPSWSWQLRHTP